jgi:hypothetical protein
MFGEAHRPGNKFRTYCNVVVRKISITLTSMLEINLSSSKVSISLSLNRTNTKAWNVETKNCFGPYICEKENVLLISNLNVKFQSTNLIKLR